MNSIIHIALSTAVRCRPGHPTYRRLSLLIGIALLASCFLTAVTAELIVPPFSSSMVGYLSFSFTAHVLTIVLLLCSSTLTAQSTFLRLMQVLPLGKVQRWQTWIAPAWFLILLLNLVFIPCIMRLGSLMGCSAIVSGLCFLVGSYAGLGVLAGIAVPVWRIRVPAAITYGGGELICLKYALAAAPVLQYVYIVLILGALCSLFLMRLPKHIATSAHTTHHTSPLPWISVWFFAKLLRNTLMRLSLMAAAVLASLLALLCVVQSLSPGKALLPAIAMLAAAVASDLRGTMARQPPEITALRGTKYFYQYAAASTFTATLIVLLPLLLLSAKDTVDTGVLALLYGAVGTGIGLAITTALRPTPRDISAQFTTMIFVLILCVGTQNFSALQQSTLAVQSLFYGGLTFVATIAGGIIEYKRNSFLWRKNSWFTHTTS